MDRDGGGFNCCHLALALTPPFFPCLSSCNHPFIQHTYLRGHASGDDAGIRKIQMMKEECDELASKAHIVLMFTWNLEGILATLLTLYYQTSYYCGGAKAAKHWQNHTQSGPAKRSKVFLFNILW